jgi:REP element-mobilizing transposase RayT
MEDHLHLLMSGVTARSNFTSMMTVLRQRTAMACRRANGGRLWQDGYHERVLRPTDDVVEFVRYIEENPRKAGLSPERSNYPYVWIAARDRQRRP